MEIKSGSGRTSSWLAKEKRSRTAGRDGKAYSSREANAGAVRARATRVKKTGCARRKSTATDQCMAGREEMQPLLTRCCRAGYGSRRAGSSVWPTEHGHDARALLAGRRRLLELDAGASCFELSLGL